MNTEQMRSMLCVLLVLSIGVLPLGAQNNQALFSLLSARKSGIKFNNVLKDTREHNIMIYSNFYGGAGVGIGDLNNDGLADLYFAGNQVADQLYVNKGNMVFEDITEKAGMKDNGGWSSGVIFGDVNQDGWLDIYVTRELYDDDPELRKNKLYINNGDLTFTESAEAYGIADSERTRNAAFLDHDKDGDLDLFLCNQPPNPGDYSPFFNTELLLEEYSIRLYENMGGRFQDVTEQAGLKRTGFPNSLTASDLNGDGWTDLYIANDFWVEDWLFLNNGDGTFTEKIHDNVRHISFSSMGVDAGDINNDGKPDVMILDMAAEDNYRLKANMSGMNPESFWKVVNDGGHHQYMFNTLQLNIGEGEFRDVAQLGNVASTDWSWSVLLADWDNDGWKDVFVSNGLMRDIRNTDAAKNFKNYVEKALYEHLSANPPDPEEEISVWDIVDIEEALSITPSEKLQNYIYRNNGDLTFSKKIEDWGLKQKTFSHGAAYADLDNDGDLDLVINNMNDRAFVYENHAAERSASHYLRIKPVADRTHVSLFGTKIYLTTASGTQYHELTGSRGMYSSSEMIAHFGLGRDKQVEEVRIIWSDGHETVETDITADQTLEISYSAASKQAMAEEVSQAQPLFVNQTNETGLEFSHQENAFNDYEKQVLLPHKMSTLGPCLARGDINGDKREDVFIGGASGQAGSLFVQQRNGSFERLVSPALNGDAKKEDLGATFFDADNDGDQDLYVVSGGNEFQPQSASYADRLYLNDGNGQFSLDRKRLPDLRISGSKVHPIDIDQDGDLDLFVAGRHIPGAYPLPASSVLLWNENGFFKQAGKEAAEDLIELGMVNDISSLDYNGDGWQDVVVVGEWMAITILENQAGKGLKKVDLPDLAASQGWWFSVETADIDQDGDEDIIAGNLGLNYKYKATETEPFEVYYYDFDENGSKDIVLTYYNFGIQYPLRGRSCSSEQVPELKQKFETYDLFAGSDVFEVYGEKSLENALHYEAQTFASMYIENLGNGKFELKELPIMAQTSSVNAILAEDFNGDGHQDLLLAGNLYDAEVETTRNDAGYGIYLEGDGQGNFRQISREESGFYVPYDVKSLLSVPSKKDQFILVGCNDDALQAFKLIRPK